MGKGMGQATKNKTIKALENLLVVSSMIIIFLAIIPLSKIGDARVRLNDVNVLGSGVDKLFQPFFLDQCFQALQICGYTSMIFLGLAIFIHMHQCHGREKKCPTVPWPPSTLEDPVHTLRPILILSVVFLLACILLQFGLGGYLKNLGPDQGIQDRWIEDSNSAESRRAKFIQDVNCCGWNNIFEYQLAPECTRAQLLANPLTCRGEVQELLDAYVYPVGDFCIMIGILELIPWFIMVTLRCLDQKVEIISTMFSAGGS